MAFGSRQSRATAVAVADVEEAVSAAPHATAASHDRQVSRQGGHTARADRAAAPATVVADRSAPVESEACKVMQSRVDDVQTQLMEARCLREEVSSSSSATSRVTTSATERRWVSRRAAPQASIVRKYSRKSSWQTIRSPLSGRMKGSSLSKTTRRHIVNVLSSRGAQPTKNGAATCGTSPWMTIALRDHQI